MMSLPVLAAADWSVNPYDYQYDMTVYLKLQVDGDENTDLSSFDVAAFCGEECRGILEIKKVAGQQYGYIRIRSNSAKDETISFKVVDKADGKEIRCLSTLDFVSDTSVGLPSNPFILTAENLYKILFVIEEDVIETYQYFGDELNVPEVPAREGYEFTGWDPELPETVPAEDMSFSGAYKILSFTASFYLDKELLEAILVEYGSEVVPPEAPEKEGYTFSGWQDVPETMPAHDIDIIGTYTVNQYILTYTVDGAIYKEYTVDFGSPVTPEAYPEKEGYSFSGWDNVPETMPAHDVTVAGAFTINSYKAVFKIGGEVIATKTFEFGQKLEIPAAPEKEGYTFDGWKDVPETMPAHDIEIAGSYVSNVDITFSKKQIHLGCKKYENATIRFTVDGSNPSDINGEIYTEPFLPAADCTIKAVAYKPGSVTTAVTSYVYVAEEHTVPNLLLLPQYLDRIVLLVPQTDEKVLAASDSILIMDRTLLKGGDEIRQMDFSSEMFDDVAMFEWKSTELLERGPVMLPIEYASAPQIDYDGASIMISNERGSCLKYTLKYDDGESLEDEETIDSTLHLNPMMTGVMECSAYDEGLFRSDSSLLDIHALRFDNDQIIMLNDSGWLSQAVPGEETQEWERLSVVGPDGSDAPISSQDLSLIATFKSLRHIDLSAASPLINTSADFSGLSHLMSLSLPKTNAYDCNWNLGGIKLLSAIKWNMPQEMTVDLFDQVINRNALVYVSDIRLAPENAVNIVCNGYADHLTLNHDYPFCVIDEFTAGEAVFTKNFNKPTVIGQSGGWETLVLPFDVHQIMQKDEYQREIRPFKAIEPGDEATPGFWLSCPGEDANGWADQDHIEGCRPYIIAMPNNSEYIEEFNITGDIDFIGRDVMVNDVISPLKFKDADGKLRTFHGSYIPATSSEYVYGLTQERVDDEVVRSVFSPEGDNIRSFECWFDGAPGMSKIAIESGQNAVIRPSVINDNAVQIWQEGDRLMIVSSKDLTSVLVDMTGAVVRNLSLKAGVATSVENLSGGIYIVAGRKVVMK